MTEAVPKGEATLVRQARDRFTAIFGREPTVCAAAPGRVNLIGEHIDYCEGYVLPVRRSDDACAMLFDRRPMNFLKMTPFGQKPLSINVESRSVGTLTINEPKFTLRREYRALPFITIVVGAPNGTAQCRITSVLATGEELQTSFPTPAAELLKPGAPAWANYVKGVVANFPGPVEGFDAVIVTDVPMGSGLSSSASVEVAVFTLLEGLSGKSVSAVEKAKLCQKAEHEFPAMPCGIMDQYIVTMGRRDHALLIDCRSLKAVQVPVDLGSAVILVTNSNVKHQLTGSEYPQRRAQCQQAAARLGLPCLRGARVEDLAELKRQNCDQLVLKRARHVIEEISRTEEAAIRLREKDLKRVGELFYQSHESLCNLMEVSCPELDQIVAILRGLPGVYGARMTGGGFGGCVISLIEESEVENAKSSIVSQYKGNPVFFISQPSEGARLIPL